jgi:hypothetical protein
VSPPLSEPSEELLAAADSMPNLAEAAMIPTDTTAKIDLVVLLTRRTPLNGFALREFRLA